MAEETKLKKLSLYELLSKPISEEAIQRSVGAKTGKGYDTTGYGYQFLVNRFNDVLGIGGWEWHFEESKEDRIEGNFKSGGKYYELTGNATITIFANKIFGLDRDISHSETGGHRSATVADARKGASTNAFKKTAGFFGVGKQAFEKSIDEDNQEQAEIKKSSVSSKEKETKKASLEETIAMIRSTGDIATLENWGKKIEAGNFWNDIQKKAILSNIDEKIKELKK